MRVKDQPAQQQTRANVRVLLVENRLLFRDGLRLLLQHHGLTVAGEVETCEQALNAAQQKPPQVVVINSRLGSNEEAGCAEAVLKLLADLAQLSAGNSEKPLPTVKPVLLVVPGQTTNVRQAIMQGVKGVVLETQPGSALVQAIERVHNGEVWIDASIMTELLSASTAAERDQQNPEKKRIASLTEREIEVIQLLAEGLKNHEIAERMFLSEGSVRHYLNRAFTKLDITDRSKLLIYAFRHGIAKPF